MDTNIDLVTQSVTPITPDTGETRIFINSDKTLSTVDDTGKVTEYPGNDSPTFTSIINLPQETSAPAYVKGGMYFNSTENALYVGGAATWKKVLFDITVPTLVSAAKTNNTTITVTLSENLTSSTVNKANAGGFTVFETGTPGTTYAVSSIASGAANEIILNVADISASALAGVTVTYTAGGNGTVADTSGNLLATDGTGVLIAAWDVPPTMVSAERLANTTVRVTLSEVCDTATTTKANDGGFVVYEIGAPATTYAVSAIAPNGSNHDQVDLTVADMTASAAVGVTVTYVAGGNGTVADDIGNLMVTDATGVNAAAWA